MIGVYQNKIGSYQGKIGIFPKNQSVGYIPTMTSNTTPFPFITQSRIANAYYAFDNDTNTCAEIILNNGDYGDAVNDVLQIQLDQSIRLWKVHYKIQSDSLDPDAGVNFNFKDVNDNILFTRSGMINSPDWPYSGITVEEDYIFSIPTPPFNIFKMNIESSSPNSIGYVYLLQLYAYM